MSSTDRRSPSSARVLRAPAFALVSRAALVGAAFLLFGLTGCASGGGGGSGGETEGTIQEVDAPATVRADEAMTVTVRGIAGPNLCWGLVRIDRERAEGRLVLTAIASSSEREGVMCGQALSEFEEELTVAPPFGAGSFEITARQDGQERVMATVEVR